MLCRVPPRSSVLLSFSVFVSRSLSSLAPTQLVCNHVTLSLHLRVIRQSDTLPPVSPCIALLLFSSLSLIIVLCLMLSDVVSALDRSFSAPLSGGGGTRLS